MYFYAGRDPDAPPFTARTYLDYELRQLEPPHRYEVCGRCGVLIGILDRSTSDPLCPRCRGEVPVDERSQYTLQSLVHEEARAARGVRA